MLKKLFGFQRNRIITRATNDPSLNMAWLGSTVEKSVLQLINPRGGPCWILDIVQGFPTWAHGSIDPGTLGTYIYLYNIYIYTYYFS